MSDKHLIIGSDAEFIRMDFSNHLPNANPRDADWLTVKVSGQAEDIAFNFKDTFLLRIQELQSFYDQLIVAHGHDNGFAEWKAAEETFEIRVMLEKHKPSISCDFRLTGRVNGVNGVYWFDKVIFYPMIQNVEKILRQINKDI